MGCKQLKCPCILEIKRSKLSRSLYILFESYRGTSKIISSLGTPRVHINNSFFAYFNGHHKVMFKELRENLLHRFSFIYWKSNLWIYCFKCTKSKISFAECWHDFSDVHFQLAACKFFKLIPHVQTLFLFQTSREPISHSFMKNPSYNYVNPEINFQI